MKRLRQSGAILIITLWILAILTLLSVGIAFRMALELKLTGYYRDNMKALYLAKAGLCRAISVVEREDHSVDCLSDVWSNDSSAQANLFKDVKVSDEGSFTISYPFNNEITFYGLQDEDRKVNINIAPKEVIEGLIAYLCADISDADRITAAILEWRGTTEAGGYIGEGYRPKGSPFDVVEELRLVKEVTPEVFDRIKDFVTVYPKAISTTAGGVNVNTAPLPVLYALGIPEDVSRAIISYRAGADAIEGTSDDEYFEDRNAFNIFLTNQGEELPSYSKNLTCFGSQYFRIILTAKTSAGRVSKAVTAVIGPNQNKKWIVLYWDEK